MELSLVDFSQETQHIRKYYFVKYNRNRCGRNYIITDFVKRFIYSRGAEIYIRRERCLAEISWRVQRLNPLPGTSAESVRDESVL